MLSGITSLQPRIARLPLLMASMAGGALIFSIAASADPPDHANGGGKGGGRDGSGDETGPGYRLVDIGTLGATRGVAVNNLGGVITDYSQLWELDAAGEVVQVVTLPGVESWASDINDAFEVVGGARGSDDLYHAVVWRVDDLIVEAGDRKNATLETASGINADGWICTSSSRSFSRVLSSASSIRWLSQWTAAPMRKASPHWRSSSGRRACPCLARCGQPGGGRPLSVIARKPQMAALASAVTAMIPMRIGRGAVLQAIRRIS